MSIHVTGAAVTTATAATFASGIQAVVAVAAVVVIIIISTAIQSIFVHDEGAVVVAAVVAVAAVRAAVLCIRGQLVEEGIKEDQVRRQERGHEERAGRVFDCRWRGGGHGWDGWERRGARLLLHRLVQLLVQLQFAPPLECCSALVARETGLVAVHGLDVGQDRLQAGECESTQAALVQDVRLVALRVVSFQDRDQRLL